MAMPLNEQAVLGNGLCYWDQEFIILPTTQLENFIQVTTCISIYLSLLYLYLYLYRYHAPIARSHCPINSDLTDIKESLFQLFLVSSPYHIHTGEVFTTEFKFPAFKSG